MSSGEGAATPREWVGDEPFPWPPSLGLADGDPVTACFSVLQVSTGRTRSDAPFLRLQLADCYGILEARVWDDVDAAAIVARPGAYIGVRGQIESYQDQRQLRIDDVAPLRVELDDLVLFLPRSSRPAAIMDAELAALIDSVSDAPLRTLLLTLLAADSDIGHAFRLAPAAKQNHHAYLGGLLEHTLSVATVCDQLARHYGAGIDRDLLMTGALLHDIGKVREIGARSGFPYTDEGKLIGHIVIGMQMVADAARSVPDLSDARLLLVQHLIAAHQGRFEWHSPREPRTLEALLLHYADDMDAKLHQAAALLDAVSGTGWSAYDRNFGRDFLRHAASAAHPGRLPEPAGRAGRRRSATRAPESPGARPVPRERSATEAQPGEPVQPAPASPLRQAAAAAAHASGQADPSPQPADPPPQSADPPPQPADPPSRPAETTPLDTLDLFE